MSITWLPGNAYCSLALPCFAGVMYLLITRHLSPEQKKEAIRWR